MEISPTEWGQGFGREALGLLMRFAFDEVNLRRLSLTVFAYNTRAIRLYEGMGFVREGTFREFLVRDGQPHDMLLYGLLEREWRAARHGAVVDLPSVWHREAPVPVARWGDGPGPTRVDLAIVGGGLMAAWLAYHASAQAAGRWAITVLSDRPLAHGAPGRNAGFVLGGTSELYATLVGQLGRPAARELLALSQSNRQHVRAV